MKRRLYQLDVFTHTPLAGNPLAVITDGDGLSTKKMQAIAREMNLSETVFIQKPTSDRALARLRIFTTTQELPLAGHPVIGTWFLLAELGVVPAQNGAVHVCQQTGAGVLPVTIEFKDGRPSRVTMTQKAARFFPARVPKAALMQSLGLKLSDLHASLPLEYVSTGIFNLMVPLRARATQRIYIVPKRPEEVVVALRNGSTGNVVTLSLGGPEREVELAPLETRVIRIEQPKRIPVIGRPFYRFSAGAPYACQAEVAVTDEQKGVLYFNAALYKEALPYLVAAWAETKSPTLAQMAVIAARCAGIELGKVKEAAGLEDAVRADLERGGAPLFDRFGVSALYLDELPYVALEAEAISREVAKRYTRHDPAASGDTCVVPGPTEEGEWSAQMGGLFLEPGAYKVVLSARLEGEQSAPATVRVAFVDATGQLTCDEAVVALDELVGPVYREAGCTLRLGEHRGPVALRIAADPTLPLRIDTVEMKPDFEATIGARDALVRALLDGDFADLKAVPEDFDALLAYAEQAEGRGDAASAFAACEEAIEADAGSYGPYELLRRMRDRLPEAQKAEWLPKIEEVRAAHARPDEKKVSVRFKNGAELTGYRISAGEYAPGDTVEMTFYWRTAPAAASRFAGRWLFVHFVPEGAGKDEHVIQGDTEIVQDFGFDERLDRIRPLYRHRIRVPDEVEPGTYEIEIGILINVHDKRIRVIGADVPRTNNSATIGSIRIVKRAPDPSS